MNRILHLVEQPINEPVTLDEALVQCHAEQGIEDAWFTSRIKSATRKVEDYIKRSLVTQIWNLRYDGGFPNIVELPRSPVKEVLNITIDDEPVDLDTVNILTEAIPAVVVFPKTLNGTLKITYKAGYGDNGDNVPEPIKDAILLYVAHSYGNREGEIDIPKAFFDLINPYKLWTN